jgi:hypothetical protein
MFQRLPLETQTLYAELLAELKKARPELAKEVRAGR